MICNPRAQTLRSRIYMSITRRPYRSWHKRPLQANTIQQTDRPKKPLRPVLFSISALSGLSSINSEISLNCHLVWEQRFLLGLPGTILVHSILVPGQHFITWPMHPVSDLSWVADHSQSLCYLLCITNRHYVFSFAKNVATSLDQ